MGLHYSNMLSLSSLSTWNHITHIMKQQVIHSSASNQITSNLIHITVFVRPTTQYVGNINFELEDIVT